MDPQAAAAQDPQQKATTQNTINFNVMLSPEHSTMLERMAAAQQLNKSVVIRRLIIAGFGHIVQDTPICANGNFCYVPHMHPKRGQAEQPAPVPPDPDRHQ